MAITSIKTGSSFTNLVKYNDFLGPNSAYIPSSYESIASYSPTSGASITFSSIPSTYKHLQIRSIYRDTVANATTKQLTLQFNSDSGSNYANHELYGDGAAVTANGYTAYPFITVNGAGTGNSTTASIFGTSIVDINDYSASTKNKTVRYIAGINSNNTTASNQKITIGSGLWLNTNAITSITVAVGDTAFATGCVISLYGIKG
jgi:hypothetical protein